MRAALPFCGPLRTVWGLAHDDAEPALAVLDDPEHLLVVGAADVGLVDDDGPADTVGTGADAVDTAGALLQRAGVPVQVVVDDTWR